MLTAPYNVGDEGTIVRGTHGERLRSRVVGHQTNYEAWWREIIPDSNLGITVGVSLFDYALIGRYARTGVPHLAAALAFYITEAMCYRWGELDAGLDLDEPEWLVGVEGVWAFAEVLNALRERGWCLQTFPGKYLITRRGTQSR